jgi:hypothetical protein
VEERAENPKILTRELLRRLAFRERRIGLTQLKAQVAKKARSKTPTKSEARKKSLQNAKGNHN